MDNPILRGYLDGLYGLPPRGTEANYQLAYLIGVTERVANVSPRDWVEESERG